VGSYISDCLRLGVGLEFEEDDVEDGHSYGGGCFVYILLITQMFW
jgi:hypothetical protein